MKLYQLLMYPFIGALIGWLTNTIAIWMLLHPYEEKHIGPFKVPFTPGLVPRRIDKLAVEVSSAIRRHFLAGADIKLLLKQMELGRVLTQEMKKRLEKSAVLRPLTNLLDNELVQNSMNKEIDKFVERLEADPVGAQIEQFIRQRIVNEFDPRRIEEVVINVSRRELMSIRYLGGVLGGIIGLVHILIQL